MIFICERKKKKRSFPIDRDTQIQCGSLPHFPCIDKAQLFNCFCTKRVWLQDPCVTYFIAVRLPARMLDSRKSTTASKPTKKIKEKVRSLIYQEVTVRRISLSGFYSCCFMSGKPNVELVKEKCFSLCINYIL